MTSAIVPNSFARGFVVIVYLTQPDLPESTKFGEQVAVDHMVVSKSSEGKEFLVLIVHDSYSGIINAYPASSKGSDFGFTCLRHFVGHRFKNPDTVCRSDAAPELIKAIRDLGWLPETVLPRRWPHNSKCERMIRTLEECCRCPHLQAGVAMFPKLWPVTCRYAAIAMSIDKWEKAFETEFKGASYALGQLVIYRTKFQNKSKIAPNASPALMAGWKMEFGMSFKGVLTLLDYQALREGRIVIVQAPDREVYTRDKVVFPLADVAEKAREEFANPSTENLERQDPLPIPSVEASHDVRQKSKRVCITYVRIQRLGMTPGCRACYAPSSNHTSECITRHEEACGNAPSDLPARESEELQDLPDELLPPEWNGDYAPSTPSHDSLDGDLVPECPPPSDDEDVLGDGPHDVEQGVSATVSIASDFKDVLLDEEIQDVFGVVLSQAERVGCPGATAKPFEATKRRHVSSGGHVLFEFCCDEDSNLGKVGDEHGVQVVRLRREAIDLSDDRAINQLCEQVKALPGCSIHGSIECRPWSTWQRLNNVEYKETFKTM